MPKYLVVCPSCNSEFLSYEEYISHVFEKHEGLLVGPLKIWELLTESGRVGTNSLVFDIGTTVGFKVEELPSNRK